MFCARWRNVGFSGSAYWRHLSSSGAKNWCRRAVARRCRDGAAAFILMSKTALDAAKFFRIPPNRVVELGGQIEL
jgi:hypothetical protein